MLLKRIKSRTLFTVYYNGEISWITVYFNGEFLKLQYTTMGNSLNSQPVFSYSFPIPVLPSPSHFLHQYGLVREEPPRQLFIYIFIHSFNQSSLIIHSYVYSFIAYFYSFRLSFLSFPVFVCRSLSFSFSYSLFKFPYV